MSKFFELLSKNVRSLIAMFVVIFSFAFLFTLANKAVPKGNETLVNVAAGMVLTALGAVCAYYFGSSKDKSDTEKAEIQTKIIEAETKKASIPTAYNQDSAYMIGSLITKDGNSYRCITAAAAGEDFDISKWEVVK